jgi:hypothetical protein
MKKLSMTFGTVLLALGFFAFSPAAKADQPIVGLWDVFYTSDNVGFLFETWDQWHADGLEFEVNSIAPGAMCQGTWKQTSARGVKLYHLVWTFDSTGTLNGHIEETALITVSLDRNSYTGNYHQRFLDLNGNQVGEDTGTIRATRISVDNSTDTAVK